MAATAITFTKSNQLIIRILRAFGILAQGKMPKLYPGDGASVALLTGGAPADDTAATDPLATGCLGLDIDNGDVYICSAYTNSTTHAWTKISL
ncbi:hypothetical protein LCGC14_1292100 [marine sediment metagenome]|uniref:Uncharacterized protein n=1 Tax=marine sediment metagenome TaxID=412755 RepID=A0A0F9KS99_9ZZZZ